MTETHRTGTNTEKNMAKTCLVMGPSEKRKKEKQNIEFEHNITHNNRKYLHLWRTMNTSIHRLWQRQIHGTYAIAVVVAVCCLQSEIRSRQPLTPLCSRYREVREKELSEWEDKDKKHGRTFLVFTSSCITPSPLSFYSVYRDGDVQREKIKAETFGWDLKNNNAVDSMSFSTQLPLLGFASSYWLSEIAMFDGRCCDKYCAFFFRPHGACGERSKMTPWAGFQKDKTTITTARCRASPFFFFYPLPVCSDRCNWVWVQSMGGSLLNKVNAAPGLCSASVGVQSKLVHATQYHDHSLLYLDKYWMGWNRVTNTTYAQNRKGEENRRVQQQHPWTLDIGQNVRFLWVFVFV